MEEIFSDNDLVFYNNGGKIKAGGFVINSNILQKGGSAIKNLNVKNMSGGVSRMAVPAGLFLIHQNKDIDSSMDIENDIQPIGTVNDGLYDNLIKLMGGRKKGKIRNTRRKNKRGGRKTRKKM